MVSNPKTANDMDRKVFKVLINDYFYDIIIDELKYLRNRNTGFQIISPLECKEDSLDLYDKQIGELYYLYDYHKLHFKDHLGNHSVNLDRHKLTVIYLCMLIDYQPIVFINKYKKKLVYTEEMALVNYRVAFRCACAYATSALFNSFEIRLNEYRRKLETSSEEEKVELGTTLHSYENALEKLKQNGTYYFPSTREHLEKYVDTYIKVLYSQFNSNADDKVIPYSLIADTFYWIDVYNKLQLGIEVNPEEYTNGLSRNVPSDNNQEAKELTTTEDNGTAEAKKGKGKGKKKK